MAVTRIRTSRATYLIDRVEVKHGQVRLVCDRRTLTRKDVNGARWYAALDHYFGQRRGLTV